MDQNIQNLLSYFDTTFSLENLEKNAYYVNKLNENLNLRLEDVFQNRNVKAISSKQEEIVNALQKCNRVQVQQDQKTLNLNVPLKQFIALAIPEGSQTGEFKNFVQKFMPQNIQIDIIEDNDSLNLRFKNNQEVSLIYDQLENNDQFIFQGKNIEISIHQEKLYDVYQHLKNSVAKKSNKYQANNSNYVNPSQLQNQNQNVFLYPEDQFQMMFEAEIQQTLMWQEAQQLNNNYLVHLSHPQDYSDLYIRRARNDRGNKKPQNYMAQPFDPLNPFLPTYRNKKRGGQERGRQMNRRGGNDKFSRSKSRSKNANNNNNKNYNINNNNVKNNNNNINKNGLQNTNNQTKQNRNKSNRRRSKNNIKSNNKQNKPVKNNLVENNKVTNEKPAKPTNKPLNILDDGETSQKNNQQRARSKSASKKQAQQQQQSQKEKEVFVKKEDVQKTYIKQEVADQLNLNNKEKQQQQQQSQQQKSGQQTRTKSVSFQKQYVQKKEINNQSSNNKSYSKPSRKLSQEVSNMGRPRAESQSFEPLTQKNGDQTNVVFYHRKQPIPNRSRSHSKQNELKVPVHEPYVETRNKIDQQYSKFEFVTSFERWKLQKHQHPQIASLIEKYKITPIPVISNYPQTKLEVEQPLIQNSSSVTPLIKSIKHPAFRKGSATYSNVNITQSPAINNKANPSTRKYSSKN